MSAAESIEDEEVTRLRKDQHDEVRILQEGALRRLKKLAGRPALGEPHQRR